MTTVYSPKSGSSTPLLAADKSTLLTEKSQIMNRLCELFNTLLNHVSEMEAGTISQLPQLPIKACLDDKPSLDETNKAIHTLSGSKSPGSDALPVEIYKSGGPVLALCLTRELPATPWSY